MPPITTLPVTCWPQRWRNSDADRFMAAIGPMPSNASTGTTRKVTNDQMAPPMEAVTLPDAPARSRRTESASDTTTDTMAHAAITLRRLRATALAAPMSGCRPARAASAAAARATL